MNVPDNTSLVVGVGNLYRSDDAVGILVARHLQELADPRLHILEHSGEGVSLMESWKGRDHVILVDAVSSGAPPGTLHCINAVEEPVPAKFLSCSSHNFGLAEAIEMSRALDQLPRRLQVFGIEGENFQPGERLSAKVEAILKKVIDKILQQVS